MFKQMLMAVTTIGSNPRDSKPRNTQSTSKTIIRREIVKKTIIQKVRIMTILMMRMMMTITRRRRRKRGGDGGVGRAYETTNPGVLKQNTIYIHIYNPHSFHWYGAAKIHPY